MYTLNAAGDLENLVGLYNTENYHGTALARRREFFDEIGLDCSAFIKSLRRIFSSVTLLGPSTRQ